MGERVPLRVEHLTRSICHSAQGALAFAVLTHPPEKGACPSPKHVARSHPAASVLQEMVRSKSLPGRSTSPMDLAWTRARESTKIQVWPRDRTVASLHKHQLSRYAWIASPSMASSSPSIPSIPPSPFCPPCAQVSSTRSTSRRSSRPPCCTASKVDTATSVSQQPRQLSQCSFGMDTFSFRDAHAGMLGVFVR